MKIKIKIKQVTLKKIAPPTASTGKTDVSNPTFKLPSDDDDDESDDDDVGVNAYGPALGGFVPENTGKPEPKKETVPAFMAEEAQILAKSNVNNKINSGSDSGASDDDESDDDPKKGKGKGKGKPKQDAYAPVANSAWAGEDKGKATSNENQKDKAKEKEKQKEEEENIVSDEKELKGGLEYYIHKYREAESRKRMRDNPKDLATTSAEEYANLLHDGTHVSYLPSMKCCLRAKFGSPSFTRREELVFFQGLFFRRLFDMCGIGLSDPGKIYRVLDAEIAEGKEGKLRHFPFEFMDPHIGRLESKLKSMHLIDSSEGLSLWTKLQTLQEKGTPPQNLIDLATFAHEKLDRALLSVPDSAQTLYYVAEVELWLAKNWAPKEQTKEREQYYHASLQHMTLASNILEGIKVRTVLTSSVAGINSLSLNVNRLRSKWEKDYGLFKKRSSSGITRTSVKPQRSAAINNQRKEV